MTDKTEKSYKKSEHKSENVRRLINAAWSRVRQLLIVVHPMQCWIIVLKTLFTNIYTKPFYFGVYDFKLIGNCAKNKIAIGFNFKT